MNTIFSFSSASAQETKEAAAQLAQLVQADDVILLQGDLGAGKTQFSQGFGAALGVQEEMTSPTFNLVLAYEDAALPLYHFDLYRLNDESELEDIAFFDLIEAGGVSLIEWADKFLDAMPEDYLSLNIGVDTQGLRHIEVSAQGSRARDLALAWSDVR